MYIRTYTQEVPGSDDDDFLALLDEYLEPPRDPNLAMSNVQIVWVDDDPRLGALHVAEHGIAKEEVEQVLLEIPPVVEARRSRENLERTLFWGATRHDRWIFIVCEDWTEDSVRYLKPITAFEPEEGEAYWRRQ